MLTQPERSSVPIYIAALGPKSVEGAAEYADGWLPFLLQPRGRSPRSGATRSPPGTAKRSADLAPLEIAAGGMVAVGEDVKGLLDFARPMSALYIGGMGARGKNFYNDLACQYGYEAEAKEIQDLYLDGKKKEAEAAVPLELLERANLVGPESYVKERIDAFREAGVTNLQIVAGERRPAGAGAPAQGTGSADPLRRAGFDLQAHRGGAALAPENTLAAFGDGPRPGRQHARVRRAHQRRRRSRALPRTHVRRPHRPAADVRRAGRPAPRRAGADRHAARAVRPAAHERGADEVGLNIETKFDVLHPDENAPRERFVESVLEVLHGTEVVDAVLDPELRLGGAAAGPGSGPRISLNALTNTDYLEVDQPGASPWLAGIDIDDFARQRPGRGECPRLRRDLAEPHHPDPGHGRRGPRRRACACCPTRSTTSRLDAAPARVRASTA